MQLQTTTKCVKWVYAYTNYTDINALKKQRPKSRLATWGLGTKPRAVGSENSETKQPRLYSKLETTTLSDNFMTENKEAYVTKGLKQAEFICCHNADYHFLKLSVIFASTNIIHCFSSYMDKKRHGRNQLIWDIFCSVWVCYSGGLLLFSRSS